MRVNFLYTFFPTPSAYKKKIFIIILNNIYIYVYLSFEYTPKYNAYKKLIIYKKNNNELINFLFNTKAV